MNLSQLPPSALSLLEFFAQRPKGRFFPAEAQRISGISAGAANKGLRLLLGIGLLSRERVGKFFFYSLCRESPVVRQFKIFRTVFYLQPLISSIEPYSVEAVLYGSAAEGTDGEESDIDLLVVCSDKKAALDAFRTAKKGIGALGDKLSPVFATPAEFSAMRKKDAAFYSRVRQGIVVFRK